MNQNLCKLFFSIFLFFFILYTNPSSTSLPFMTCHLYPPTPIYFSEQVRPHLESQQNLTYHVEARSSLPTCIKAQQSILPKEWTPGEELLQQLLIWERERKEEAPTGS